MSLCTGGVKDGGILPRALDVVFNSISEQQLTDVTLKPTMFCDVLRLTRRQADLELKSRDDVFKMANQDEVSCL